MKRFFKWTVAVVGVGLGTAFLFEAIQTVRTRVRNALGQAEAIAAKTRATLEQTESALRDARKAV